MQRPLGFLKRRRLLAASCTLLLACTSSQGARRSEPSSENEPALFSQGSIGGGIPSETRSFPLVYAAADTQHCDQLQIACFNRCWETYPPYPVERGNKGQYRYCTNQCLKEYMDCVKEAEAHPRTFPNKMTAMDWLEKHKTEVVVGTIIFAGGAAFIIGTGGAGILILIPVAAL
jgi:hypothetical protein